MHLYIIYAPWKEKIDNEPDSMLQTLSLFDVPLQSQVPEAKLIISLSIDM